MYIEDEINEDETHDDEAGYYQIKEAEPSDKPPTNKGRSNLKGEDYERLKEYLKEKRKIVSVSSYKTPFSCNSETLLSFLYNLNTFKFVL